MVYNEQCRWFSGYKPCKFKRSCEACPHYKPVETRIAIVSLEAMGAVLRSTCLLQPILRKYPQAHITWVTLKQSAPLLAENPLIDRVICLGPASAAVLDFLEFDHLFGVDKSMEAGALVERMQAKKKWGFGLNPNGVIRPLNSFAHYQYEVGLNDELKFFQNEKPETQQITETMGLRWERDPYILSLSPSEIRESERRREMILNLPFELGGKSKSEGIIGYNTGCSVLFPYKKFTVPRAVETIRQWRKSFPTYSIALLGGPEDHERQLEMKAAFADDPYVFNSPCRGGLRSGILWMNTSDVVFSGCSLGMHMAIGLGKKVVAWFGVSCIQEIDLYDRGVKLQAEVSCSPCWKKSCDNEPKCFDQVSPQRVADAVKSVL
ncbi:MAG: glycosyltransferase family 9 protein [Oligoflexales bacterium]|nr:glycosyltransferase family 9 protein [Oligoflexales bacterium]